MIVPTDPRTIEPEYEPTDETLSDYYRKYGSPVMLDNLYPTVIYGWWVGRDYVSMRVTGREHEAYRWVDRPEPTMPDDSDGYMR